MVLELRKKNIFILLESHEDDFDLISYFTGLFPEYGFFLFFWDEQKQVFYSKESGVKDLFSELFFADIVINLLSKNNKIYIEVGQKIEKLKLGKWQNSLATNLLFAQKANIKKLFSKFNLQTPAFKKIEKDDSNDLFLNFPQPSRIFSKTNDFFSEKISSLEELKLVMSKINTGVDSYSIEEYIDGVDWYIFVYKKNNQLKTYFYVLQRIVPEIQEKIEKKILEFANQSFKDFGIEKYALFHFIVNKKGDIYFLNILTDLQLFIGTHKQIMENIFKKHHFNLNDILE